MEPKLPAPNPSYERGAHTPQELPPRSEVMPQAHTESVSERPAPQEAQPVGSVGSGHTLPTPQLALAPAGNLSTPVLSPLPLANDSNPLVASDDEVIEKEWVDKAKKIITQTKDDPYQQEKEVSKLQADYLKKRYGKELKIASD
jgi:hypothetical protein